MKHWGACHCGAIRVEFETAAPLAPRACQCSFCRKHGARTVSDPEGTAELRLAPETLRYRFASRAADYLLCSLGQGCVFDLRMGLSRRILGAPLRQLEEIGAPRMLATLTEDVAVIINALLYIPLLCINVAIVAGCVVYLGWLSPVMLLLVLGFMLVGAVT